jgi:hypothetical protein
MPVVVQGRVVELLSQLGRPRARHSLCAVRNGGRVRDITHPVIRACERRPAAVLRMTTAPAPRARTAARESREQQRRRQSIPSSGRSDPARDARGVRGGMSPRPILPDERFVFRQRGMQRDDTPCLRGALPESKFRSRAQTPRPRIMGGSARTSAGNTNKRTSGSETQATPAASHTHGQRPTRRIA